MDRPFPISICMAGAVSAGAYTAGVMAELISAIRLWLDSDEVLPHKPPHRVEIKGFSGASAGSIQAVLSSLDFLADDAEPGVPQEIGKMAWFDASLEKLLDLSDLEAASEAGQVRSILNSDALRAIADRAISKHKWVNTWPAYLSDPLKLRLSITNLRGVPFNIHFPKGNVTDFGMSTHNEYIRYQISQHDQPNANYHSINFGDSHPSTYENLISGALASSAFPIAFSPVAVKRASLNGQNFFTNHNWMDASEAGEQNEKVSVDFKLKTRAPDWNLDYGEPDQIYAIDGGATNNEPLIEALKILFGDDYRDWRVPDDEQAGRVLMVDPFPNAVDKDVREDILRVDKSVGTLVSALIGHARFSEPLMISEELQNRVGLVYPALPNREGKLMALRSGALGGFSGFLKKDFVKHDYQLGRLNMRRFLRFHFTLPETDPLFENWSDVDKDCWRVQKADSPAALPIIPVYQKTNNDDWEVFNVSGEDRETYYRDGLSGLTANFTRIDRNKLNQKLSPRVKQVGLLLLERHKDFHNNKEEVEPVKKSAWQKITGFFGGATRHVKKGSSNWMMKKGWTMFGASYVTKAVVRTIEDALQEQGYLDYTVEKKSK